MGLPSSTLFTLLVATPTPTTIGIGSVNMPMSSETMSLPSESKSRSCGSSPQGSSSVRDVALIER